MKNSTSGPQPYQPYEAKVTNSPISNSKLPSQSKISKAIDQLESQSSGLSIDLLGRLHEYELMRIPLAAVCLRLIFKVNPNQMW